MIGELPEWSPIGIPSGERGNILGKMYYTYILKSKSHSTHYYGHTKDLNKRLDEHNKGYVRYTKGRRPWMINYYEIFETKSEAAKRELYFKSIDGYNFLKKEKII